MRILLPAIGSSGDIHPVIGIGIALKARGHQVTVVTNEIFAEQIRARGLGFVALGTRAEAEAMMSDPGLWHPRKGFEIIFRKAVLPNIRRLYEIIAAHRDPAAVVAATTLCLGARVAQDRLGVPTATLHLQPLAFQSLSEYGRLGPLNLGRRTPRILKRAIFWIGDNLIVDPVVGPTLNAFRAELGLGPVNGIFSSYVHSPRLVLGLFPEWFAAPQPDWPPNTHLTGFILHDDDGRSALPGDAEEFLGAGPKPILVTPGSAAMDRGRFFQTTVDACRATGTRAMLVTNFPAQLPKDLPEGIRAFSYLPFSRVLPRCFAVAYHGGVGTLAQAVNAGVPHLVVANTFDQPDNGQRVERLGLGISIGQGRFHARNAARALSELATAQSIARHCAEFATRVDPGGSLERACSLIERLG